MRPDPKIGILIVAYDAPATLATVLDRIPPSIRPRIREVIVSDDHSDDVYQQAVDDLPLIVIRQPTDLGYGGHQKSGYRRAIEHDLDIVVLLHGDGYYAPERLPDMVQPLIDGRADAVFGSRMLVKGAARREGMPLYKFVGNKILTTMENALAGMELSEFHSGYRAYTTAALSRVDFAANSDDFDFDTQLTLQLHRKSQRIVEVPIPSYDGSEIGWVGGIRYARDVVKRAVDDRVLRAGLNAGIGGTTSDYEYKPSGSSSNGRIVEWMSGRDASKVLDIGCATGEIGRMLRDQGHYVVGVDVSESEGVTEKLDQFVLHDLDHGLPAEVTGQFDVILCADVLEHLRQPDELLASLHGFLQPTGTVLVSVPNVAHWYPWARMAAGRFDYDHRGILDAGHLRFFTNGTFHRLAERCGFSVHWREAIGLPFDALGLRSAGRALRAADRVSVKAYPSLFAYQNLYEMTPASR